MNKLSVEAFRPYGSPADILLQYPHTRPMGSFLTDGQIVTTLPSDFAEFSEAADASLADVQLPLLRNRLPVVSYGTNSNPAKLAEKMSAFDSNSGPRLELQTLPHVAARIPGASVVWHGRPGQKGSTFAELYKGEETRNQEAVCHLAFMTPQQLALMHATEGVTYHLASVDATVGGRQGPLRAYAYVAGHSTVLLRDNLPVPVKRVGEVAEHRALSAEEAVDYMLASVTDKAKNARELVDQLHGLNLETRKARQLTIATQLGERGLRKIFCYPTGADGFIGRADFNVSPGIYHLAEQVVETLRPADRSLRHTKHDIAHRLRLRATDELADLLHR